MPEVPADLQAFFLAAGWYPGRVVPVPEGVPGGHPAAGILAGFLGLKVFNPGAGEECPTSDIDFMAQPFEDSSHELYEATVGEHLVTVAEVGQGYSLLLIDGKGRWFGASLVHDAFWLCGESMTDALRTLLQGRRVRPVLLHGQASTSLYGIDHDASHPAVYRP
ncbi:SUKH-3 domain-containing protein [Variovorax paradoxus]|uniref:SUKH-3 domain-containing protein n=1 Tax=Variovorax paradoxus TaxID=34073 RepID=UPI0028649FE6|nr:SUKH-3 domain-containing protein [Variovorax paradoxus]MDR6451357.1 hypothetical protein [Variovorax paradoxus]